MKFFCLLLLWTQISHANSLSESLSEELYKIQETSYVYRNQNIQHDLWFLERIRFRLKGSVGFEIPFISKITVSPQNSSLKIEFLFSLGRKRECLPGFPHVPRFFQCNA